MKSPGMQLEMKVEGCVSSKAVKLTRFAAFFPFLGPFGA